MERFEVEEGTIDMGFQLFCGDVIKVLRHVPDNSCHGCFCDPPYGLKFMGKKWDHGVPGKEYWVEVLRVLKPGAFILAFGGARTSHRLACAIEDAGFEIRDTIEWLYGSGFPKSHDISKGIDKLNGDKREIVGVRQYGDGHVQRSSDDKLSPPIGTFKRTQDNRLETIAGSDQSALWSGYGTALKPAHEPIILAMKPCQGTFAENALESGVAGLNIDGCRVGTGDNLNGGTYSGNYRDKTTEWQNLDRKDGKGSGFRQGIGEFTQPPGRWPANLILSHHESCLESECHPLCAVRLLDEQSGLLHSQDPRTRHSDKVSGGKIFNRPGMSQCYADKGGASRFFYCAKVSPAERTAGNIPNNHPTLKPISLCTYLARLILPPVTALPSHPLRLLVPFCGTGSEMAGALLAGWPHVVGIDNDSEFIDIARDRIPELIRRGLKQ